MRHGVVTGLLVLHGDGLALPVRLTVTADGGPELELQTRTGMIRWTTNGDAAKLLLEHIERGGG